MYLKTFNDMKAPKIVQAPEGDYNGIFTVGKNYQVIGLWSTNYDDMFGFRFIINVDNGAKAHCFENNDTHLNYGNWIIIERES